MRPTGLSLSVPATRILSQTGSDKKQIWTNKEFLGLCHPRLSEGHQIWGACYHSIAMPIAKGRYIEHCIENYRCCWLDWRGTPKMEMTQGTGTKIEDSGEVGT